MQQYLSAPPQDGDPHQQPTMNPNSATAMAPFNLLGLPQELRDEIYELAIFDLSPLPMFNTRSRADGFAYRNMNTNILLTSRKMYWEARDVIVRRGRMVMVSATHLYPRTTRRRPVPVEILTNGSKIAVIHPKYRNLCVMSHHINSARLSSSADVVRDEHKWEFIIHQRDIKNFCHVLMGKLSTRNDSLLSPRSTHTLFLHCPPNYARHEYKSVDAMQIRVLQHYRSILRGFEDIAICGTSIGWESGLYSAALKGMRATDARRGPIQFIDGIMNDLRDLEKEGFDTLSQTGDLEAADVSWFRALAVCRNARNSFASATRTPPPYKWTSRESNIQMWAQLISTHGNTCAVPIIEFWYRLLSIRLSQVLRLIQRGGHLATRHGRAPLHPQIWGECVLQLWDQSKGVGKHFHTPDWLPEPSEEAQMCCTVAAIFRLLDDPRKAYVAFEAMDRAIELLPDEEAINQEMCRVDNWMARDGNDPILNVQCFSMVPVDI